MTLELLHGSPDSPLKLWKRDYWVYASRKYVTYSEGNQKPDGVAIFGFKECDGERKLLVTREFRKPLNTYIWALPAGLIDEGETVEQAARRELKEESGYDLVRVLKSMSHVGFPTPGLTDESVAVVFCDITGEASKAGLEGHEDISTELMSLDKLLNLTGPIDSRLAMMIAFLNMKESIQYD